jgi:hypothetical protein
MKVWSTFSLLAAAVAGNSIKLIARIAMVWDRRVVNRMGLLGRFGFCVAYCSVRKILTVPVLRQQAGILSFNCPSIDCVFLGNIIINKHKLPTPVGDVLFYAKYRA